jgi:hypothetical protein
MDSIKVKKSELLDKLKTNHNAHKDVFEKALEGYRKMVIEHLETMLAEARSGKKIRRTVELKEPVNQTKDYTRVIAMLEMSQDDIIELSELDFQQYVLDDWAWKAQFSLTNSAYTNQ